MESSRKPMNPEYKKKAPPAEKAIKTAMPGKKINSSIKAKMPLTMSLNAKLVRKIKDATATSPRMAIVVFAVFMLPNI